MSEWEVFNALSVLSELKQHSCYRESLRLPCNFSTLPVCEEYKMKQFADEAIIEVTSGKGGNGCVSFRREKYVPMGGPNGGDGGKGGDVIFCVKRNVKTLANIRFKRFFKAKNGGDGMGWNKYG